MNKDLENIKTAIEQSGVLSEEEKETLLNSIKAVDKELTIVEFKLERTEKVKRTTSVLLEETIAELEKKRADVVEANQALKKSLDELKATQAQLIHSEKMASLGELTAGIAHEIQNPLNFVNNFSEVNAELISELEEEIINGNNDDIIAIARSIRENEEKIKHHGKRAEDIVKGMLQHSRSGSGVKELTDINLLADEYLRLAYHGFRAKDKSFNVDFKLNLDKSLPMINAVPQDIGRVLLNLINNAFYASIRRSRNTGEDDKPMVEVTTKKSDKSIEVSIVDNGPGISEDIKDKIFQPFFTTKPAGSGTGLGLSLSYDIVKAHGGEILLSPHKVDGAEFIIHLPVNKHT